MANLQKQIVIKLTIDGNEFTTVINDINARIAELEGKFKNISSNNSAISNSAKQAAFGTKEMDNALWELGSTLVDADEFLVSFKDGAKTLLGHLPALIQGFASAKAEAGNLGTIISKHLISSLAGQGGLGLAINGVMLLLEVLPGLFSKTTVEVKDQALEVAKLSDEYKKLTSEQLQYRLEAAKNKLAEFEQNYPALEKSLPSFNAARAFGGLSPFYFEQVGDQNRFGDDYIKVKLLKESISLLKTELFLKGDVDDADIRLIANRKKLDDLNEKNFNFIMPGAKSEEEAEKILNRWIIADEEIINRRKGRNERSSSGNNQNDEFEKQNRQLELTQAHEINMAKIEEKSEALILDIKRKYLAERIKLYEQYKQDTTGLVYELTETEAQFNKANRPAETANVTGIKDYEANPNLFQENINIKWGDPLEYARLTKQQELDAWKLAEEEKVKIYANSHDMLKAIDEEYQTRQAELDREVLLSKISTTGRIVSTIADSYNQIFSAIEGNVKKEVNDWKDKEDKKLDEERKAALKHARTQAQRDKINAEFDKRAENLEKEKQKRAEEKLGTWFAFQKAVNIIQATSNTAVAATEALASAPPPFNYALMAAVIAAGIGQVAIIAAQQMPSYAKGGAVIGENGPEIIAPFQDYASGQSKLITMTMMTLKEELRMENGRWKMENGASDNKGLILAINKLNKRLDEGIDSRAYLDDRQAKRIYSRGSTLNRRSKI